MHGPVRNGVLADIVQVDPHVHACAPVTIIQWLTRPPKLQELDLSWRVEEGELLQPSGISFQRADMIPRGRDPRVRPFRPHPWPPVPGPRWCPVPGSPVLPRPGLPRRPPSLATPWLSLLRRDIPPCALPRGPSSRYTVVPSPGLPRARPSRGLRRHHPTRFPPPPTLPSSTVAIPLRGSPAVSPPGHTPSPPVPGSPPALPPGLPRHFLPPAPPWPLGPRATPWSPTRAPPCPPVPRAHPSPPVPVVLQGKGVHTVG